MANELKLGQVVRPTAKRAKDKLFVIIGRRPRLQLSKGKTYRVYLLKRSLEGPTKETYGADIVAAICNNCGELIMIDREGFYCPCGDPR